MKSFSEILSRIFIMLSIWVMTNTVHCQSLRINEFMALNETVLTDEDGDFSDWIEIYNSSGDAIHLEGWGLTDEEGMPHKWTFPDITLNAGDYLLLFASGKDRTDAAGELHTNFKLSGSGEYFALFDPSGVALTEFNPAYPFQQPDFSYGMLEGAYVEFSDPTPGEDNELSGGTVVPAPLFSVAHGFYESPFSLTISSGLPGAAIYYTTDGSAPSENRGTLYTSPVSIETTTVLRAIAVHEDQTPSKITTQTYLFPDDIIHQSNNPAGYPVNWGPYTAIEGTAIADYEMDPELMADPAFADDLKAALLDIPTISLVTDKGYLFSHSEDPDTGGIYIYTGPPLSGLEYGTGRGWERPVSFEYFDNNAISLQADCGIRIQGGHSRRPEKSPKHSFLLVFKSEYGPSKLHYNFFGENAVSEYNNLILRSGFGNSWIHHSHDERQRAQYQRDIWTKDAQRAMGHLSSNSSYVHLYINGIYWGIYAPSERLDADFCAGYLGGQPEDYDVIKDYTEIVNGDIDAWDQMMDMANAGLTDDVSYQRIQGNKPDGTPDPELENMVDVVNLADYMLVNFYGSNTDWDHHNWAAVRNRVDPGKGFRFLCWDAEHMLKSLTGNELSENNNDCPSRVFQQLRQNDDFKRLFANRVQKHCFNNGVLTPEAALARWMERRNQIEDPVLAESARWGDYRRDVHPFQTVGPFELYTREDHWYPQQDFMTNTYFPGRTDVFLDQLKNAGLFPRVDAPVFYINDAPVTDNTVSVGDRLSITAAEGTIYYTTSGADPVDWTTIGEDDEIILIDEGATKRVFVPRTNIGTTWFTSDDYNDSGWQTCSGSPGGVGYEKNTGYEGLISLDVGNDMHEDGTDPNPSCYIRIPFQIEAGELPSINTLLLKVLYDDGFAAYLNGIKVAAYNAPEALRYNSSSTAGHEAEYYETFNISAYIGYLTEGENILAIHGLNAGTSSSDFLINASLIASNQGLSGSLSPEALLYSSPVYIEHSMHAIARTFHNGEWSAASDMFFIIPGDYQDIKVTEIHYNPLSDGVTDGGQFEFLELKNTGEGTLDIGGLQFIRGIEFEFPPETELGAGEFVVLVSDNDAFYSRYDFPGFGEYDGKLSNDGELLILVTQIYDTVLAIRYNDAGDWPALPDGNGYSLVPVSIDPDTDQNDPLDWRASYSVGGSPGKDDLPPASVPIIGTAPAADPVLIRNYPNPFKDITWIDYQLPYDGFVEISVYNIMGQYITSLVRADQTEGLYQVEWDGTDDNHQTVPNGMYIYRITIRNGSQNHILTRKMMLMRP